MSTCIPTVFGPSGALGGTPVVRPDVGGLTASSPTILSYRKAIKKMKGLDADNPLSWSYQAAIHGTPLPPAQWPPNAPFDTCEHNNYFFWSWHRIYLYWFERIVRKMSGDDDWAVPYWDWKKTKQRTLPAMFGDPANDELYVSQRAPGMNDGSASLSPADVAYDIASSPINFTTASEYFEHPHGVVHVRVGGQIRPDKSGWMTNPATAAQDPIFWLHHANMDRLWSLWLAQGSGRSSPIDDRDWRQKQFIFFDENGHEVRMTGCEVLRASEQLNYSYEGEPTQVNQSVPPYCRFGKMEKHEAICAALGTCSLSAMIP